MLFALCGALLLPVSLPAQATTRGTPIPLDSAIHTGTLPNGVRYYVRQNVQPRARAELRLVVNAGSVLEDEKQRGLAHFVEHMAFNGTRNFPKQELVKYLESVGMRFGADLNAYTSFDETVYMLQVPTDTGTALERGVQILEDWAHGQLFDGGEIEKERGVVIEEWRLGQGAQERMRREYFPVLLRGSRYAERLPIGDTLTLATFQPAELERYYRDWYRPDLMAVIAVGDFDPVRVEALIRERFGELRATAVPPARPMYPVPDHAEPLVTIARDREATNTILQVFFKRPVQPRGTEEAYRRGLAETLHNSMLNARLAELTQKADPPFIGASAGYGGLLRTKSAFTLGAAVADSGLERGLDAVLTELERVRRHGFADTELERQKTNLLRYYEQAYAEREKSESADYTEEYLRNYLEGEAIPGIAYEYQLVQRLLPQISLGEVNSLGRAWVSDSNRVIVVMAPERAEVDLPTPERLLAAFIAVRSRDLEPYADAVADAPLVAQPPPPGSITAEQTYPEIGVTEWRLANGVRVLLKPTDFKDDEVLFAGWSPGGASLVEDSVYYDAVLSPIVIGASGLGEFDAIQLNKRLTGKAATVAPTMGDLEEGLQGSASPKDLETLFQLAYLHFAAPRLDTVAFESYRGRLEAYLANRSRDPGSAFADTLTLTLTQHHPRGQPMTAELIDGISGETAFRVYQDRFRDASDFTFVFAGAFELDTIRPLVTQWLGGMPSIKRAELGQDRGVRPPKGVVERVLHQGLEPKSQTQLVFTGDFPYTRENRHLLNALVAVLDIRLRDVLREDLGGTYGVAVSAQAQHRPVQSYNVTIRFGAAPDRLETLTAEVFRQIDSLKLQGPPAEVVERVKEQERRERETARRTNTYWLAQLLRGTQIGDPPGAFLAADALTEQLTPAMVQEAARRWLDTNNYVRVTLFPEK
jgi:zinc protease